MRIPAGSEPRLRPRIEAIDVASPRDPLDIRLAPNGVELLQVPGWEHMDWLWHGFSTRRGGFSRAYAATASPGELNLGFTAEDDRGAVARNRQLLTEAVTGNPAAPLVTVRQIHSNLVLRAAPADTDLKPLGKQAAKKYAVLKGHDFSRAVNSPKSIGALASEGRLSPNPPDIPPFFADCKADGLITDQPGLLLAVMTADCIPVLVADRRCRVVAAFHAGWRGTVKRIVECGVGRMRLHFGSRPGDLVAAIGPGIGACCYAVGEGVQAAFESQFAYARELFTEVYDPDPVRLKYPMLFLNQRAPGHAPPMMSLRLDLAEANRRQLIDAGLRPGSIHSAGACTRCQTDRFFSYRAEHGRTGRMMAVIGIRGGSK